MSTVFDIKYAASLLKEAKVENHNLKRTLEHILSVLSSHEAHILQNGQAERKKIAENAQLTVDRTARDIQTLIELKTFFN